VRLASELDPRQLPHFLGLIEEARQVARLRLTPVAPATPADKLMTVKETAEHLHCSEVYLYKTALPFKLRLGKKLLFSANGITEYLQKQK
jgi:hypothetical protein